MTAWLIGSEGLGEFGLLALGLLMQLEHLIGFSANKDECVQFHPNDEHVLISYSGTIILISSTDDLTCVKADPEDGFGTSGTFVGVGTILASGSSTVSPG